MMLGFSSALRIKTEKHSAKRIRIGMPSHTRHSSRKQCQSEIADGIMRQANRGMSAPLGCYGDKYAITTSNDLPFHAPDVVMYIVNYRMFTDFFQGESMDIFLL